MANKPNNKVAKDVKKNSKDKRHFMKDFRAELKKVVWPTPKELLSNTVAVITIVAIVTVIVLVLDLGFKAIVDQGINKGVKSLVSNEIQAENVDNTTDTNETDNSTENETSKENTENPESQENTVE